VGLKEAVEEAKRPGEVDQSPRTLRRCLAEIAPSRRRWEGRVAQAAGGGTGTAGRRFKQGGRGVGKEERGRQLRAQRKGRVEIILSPRPLRARASGNANDKT